jgi:miniconductance mechanosensitive channel
MIFASILDPTVPTAEQSAAVAAHDPLSAHTPDFAEKLLLWAKDLLAHMGLATDHTDIWERSLIFIGILLVAFLVWLLLNKVVTRVIHYVVDHASQNINRILYKNNFFAHLFGLVPPLLVLILLPLAFSADYVKTLIWMEKIISIYVCIIVARILISLLQSGFDLYLQKENIEQSIYKGVVEMGRLIIIGMGALTVAGILLNFKISQVITTLSASAAVLILVFKDTLLGFVAGIQLAQNKMIHIGDWIVVPGTPANGNVIDISILTVVVQNFDNTLIYVPAYTLVTSSFQNWIGMSQAGVRRVKKSILIDVHSVTTADSAMLDRIYADPLVNRYLTKQGIESLAADRTADPKDLQTNLGLFRVWVRLMLEEDDQVSKAPYMIIQNLPAEGAGLPLCLNFFINTTDWNTFENAQSRIFEQVMTALPNFGLRQFQFDSWTQSPNNPALAQGK